MTIQSHKGPYDVHFREEALELLNNQMFDNVHFIIDEKVAGLYADSLSNVVNSPSVLMMEATEDTKTLDKFTGYIEHLVSKGIRRDHTLVAIGGGVIQDTTCFLAATLLRGVRWTFYPTTLLSQADSCIGSKSSINVGQTKNIVGTFTPPNEVYVSTRFLDTLSEPDIRSGVGEILKVHAIAGQEAFAEISQAYSALFSERPEMIKAIHRALEIKKAYIEKDEFDRGPRNIFNYGHSFGHAIEAATEFAIPHGIAVTIGMDMANFVSRSLNFGRQDVFDQMHPTLQENYRGFERTAVPMDGFVNAILKDKKNTGSQQLTLILPDKSGALAKTIIPNDDSFQSACEEYLTSARLS